MVGNRRKARERALQLLYQDEYVPGAQRQSAERYFWDEGEGAASEDEVRLFCRFLVDGVRANRDAIGAVVAIRRRQAVERHEITAGGGHASGSVGWLHFGLGAADAAEIRVLWPNGPEGDWQKLPGRSFQILRPDAPPEAWTPG